MQPSNTSDFDPDSLKNVAFSRDLRAAHQELIKRYSKLATEFAETYGGQSLLITTVYRSPDEQKRLWRIGRENGQEDKGRIVTQLDGFNKKSLHNVYPARALDVVVLLGGKPTWDEKEFYKIGAIARKYNLGWGGFWTTWQDYPHLELPKEVE